MAPFSISNFIIWGRGHLPPPFSLAKGFSIQETKSNKQQQQQKDKNLIQTLSTDRIKLQDRRKQKLHRVNNGQRSASDSWPE